MKKGKTKTPGGLESMLSGLYSAGKALKSHIDETTQVDILRIKPNPYQPRQVIDMLDSDSLVESIRLHGVLQPILVRKIDDGYEIVAGERRWLASKLANKKSIPCLIKDFSDQETQIIAMVENLQREELNAIDTANGFFTLSNKYRLTHEEISNSVGKPRSSISNLIRLLALDPVVQELVRVGALELGHAKLLTSLSIDLQIELAKHTVDKKLTVRQLELLIKSSLTTSGPRQKAVKFNPKTSAISLALERRFGVKFKVAMSPSKQNVLYLGSDEILEAFMQGLCEYEIQG